MKQIIETYIKRLELEHELVVSEILKLIGECVTDRIIGIEDRMAALFCRAISELPQEVIDNDTAAQIVKAFKNIQTLANENRNTSELKTVFFLAEIYNKQESTDEIEEFECLLDNLEKIRIVFKIKDDKEELVFPIGAKIFNIINCDNLMTEIVNVKSVQALMLALQIFDKNKYPRELSQIETIVRGKGLRFIEYLFNGAIRLGGVDWKKNYEANGTLILYDISTYKILVRNTHREYFDMSDINNEYYNISECKAEKNDLQEDIAFYVEYKILNQKQCNIKEQLTCKNNSSNILQILSLIFDEHYYNIAVEDSLVCVNDMILPLNPFSKHDSKFIYERNEKINPRRAIADWLYKYALIDICGAGLNYINLGTIIFLLDINEVKVRDLGLLESDIKLDKLIVNWISLAIDKQKTFNDFLKRFEEHLQYVKEDKLLFEKTYSGEYLLPYQISEDILKELGFESVIIDNPIYICDIKYDFFEEKYQGTIVGDTDIDLSEYHFKDLDGESISPKVGMNTVIVNHENNEVYYGTNIQFYKSLENKIKSLNERLLKWDVVNKVQEIPLSRLTKMMRCFERGFNKIHPDIPIEAIAKYRIANHMLLLKLDSESVDLWLKLMLKHELVDYSIIENKTRIYNSGDVLYVAKDRSRSQGTLKQINDMYIFDPLVRSDIDIFDQKITLDSGEYKVNGNVIKSIYFLFDLIQNGTATKNTLDYYMNSDLDEDDRHMSFYCDGKRVHVLDIIQNNACGVKIHTIYSGKDGRGNVQEYWNEKYNGIECEVIEPLFELSKRVTSHDYDLIRQLYKGKLIGKISVGDYLVVREFNQPAHNIMSDYLQSLDRICALFCRRTDRDQKVY